MLYIILDNGIKIMINSTLFILYIRASIFEVCF